MIKYFERRFEDQWHVAAIERCQQMCPQPVEIFVSSVTLNTVGLKDYLITNNFRFSEKNVIFFIQDHFHLVDFFVDVLTTCINNNPDTNFVLIVDFYNPRSQFQFRYDNVQYISIPTQCLYHKDKYVSITPINKNFESKKTTLSLNRFRKTFRTAALCALYGLKIDHNVHASFLDGQYMKLDFDQEIDWSFRDDQQDIKNILSTGFECLKNSTSLVREGFFNINQQGRVDSFSNFNRRLKSLFENSFVELISETLFYEDTPLINEKTYHSFLGGNIPIWNGTSGTVDAVRDLGFDVFDDIIDHSYTKEKNLVDRVYKSIYNNKTILENSDFAKQTWLKVQDRIESNFEKAKNFPNQMDNYLDQEFAKITWK